MLTEANKRPAQFKISFDFFIFKMGLHYMASKLANLASMSKSSFVNFEAGLREVKEAKKWTQGDLVVPTASADGAGDWA